MLKSFNCLAFLIHYSCDRDLLKFEFAKDQDFGIAHFDMKIFLILKGIKRYGSSTALQVSMINTLKNSSTGQLLIYKLEREFQFQLNNNQTNSFRLRSVYGSINWLRVKTTATADQCFYMIFIHSFSPPKIESISILNVSRSRFIFNNYLSRSHTW